VLGINRQQTALPDWTVALENKPRRVSAQGRGAALRTFALATPRPVFCELFRAAMLRQQEPAPSLLTRRSLERSDQS
jgi:hypothetical protein